MTKTTLGKKFLAGFGSVVILYSLNASAGAAGLHKGNWNTPEARSCAEAVEAKYNRRVVDRYDARKDSERSVQITFHSVAQVPHLFGGNKFVSMEVAEYASEGDVVYDSRIVRNASYCVLDRNNRVLGLEREMR